MSTNLCILKCVIIVAFLSHFVVNVIIENESYAIC